MARFQKGQSGDRGGRPKLDPDVVAAARGHSVEAVEILAGIMRNGDSDSARVRAAEILLNRGWGSAPQTIAIEPVQHVKLIEFVGEP